jgi:ribosomal protein S18 acetylase RimI-like enzyme
MGKIRIEPALTAEDIDQVRALMAEYWRDFGFTPCFQGFGDELKGLPGAYAPPHGGLMLAWSGDAAAGCIALRKVDEKRVEAKRLYVRPGFRGCGVGRALMERAIAEARAMGYAELVGDTMPVMQTAIALYRALGFEGVDGSPVEGLGGAVPIRLKL